MKIAHFSDIHGNIDKLLSMNLGETKVVVNTGDLMPNCSRGNVEYELTFQRQWVHDNLDRFAKWIGGRYLISIMGNHDFYPNFAADLSRKGIQAYALVAGSSVKFTDLGLKFAGFGEIPYIQGEWNGEAREPELRTLVEHTLIANPDILVTHSPPAGILDDGNYGNKPLLAALTYQEHKIKTHLFGHCHGDGGKTMEEMGIKFYNGATKLRFIEIADILKQ